MVFWLLGARESRAIFTLTLWALKYLRDPCLFGFAGNADRSSCEPKCLSYACLAGVNISSWSMINMNIIYIYMY